MNDRRDAAPSTWPAALAVDRIPWIDVLRGIAILLVLVGHRRTLPGVWEWIGSFHVPLFMAVSGYLYDRRRHGGFVAFLGSRSRRLLVPFIVFSVLSVPVEIWTATTGPVRVAVDGKWLLDLGGRLVNIEGIPPFNAPVWFLLSLFTVEIAYYWIARIESRRLVVALLSSVALLGYLLSRRLSVPAEQHIFWNLDLSVTLLPFYGFGNLLRRVRIPRLGAGLFCALTSVSLGIGFWLQIWLGRRIWYGAQSSPLDLVLFYAAALASIIVAFSVAQGIGQSRVLQALGRDTLLLFGTHYLLFGLFDSLNARFLPFMPQAVVSGWVIITTIFVVFAVRGLVHRYVPWVVGIVPQRVGPASTPL